MTASQELVLGTWTTHLHTLQYDEPRTNLSITSSIDSSSPAWMCLAQDSLYVVQDLDEGPGGLVKFNHMGEKWEQVWSTKTSSMGPCHCSVAVKDPKRFILVANYVGHTVDVFDDEGVKLQTIEYEGSGPFEGRQESSHTHQIIQDLKMEFVYVTDLGNDLVHRYTMSQDGSLTEVGNVAFKPGQGPRHISFNSLQPNLTYTICELSNDIVIHDWSGSGAKVVQEVSTLPDANLGHKRQLEGYPQPASAGEIWITRDGKNLYATNRFLPKDKIDTILFAPIEKDGRLGKITHINTGLTAPWHIAFNKDETRAAVAFRESSIVKIYERNAVTGDLSEIASLSGGVEMPSCVLFL